jgi:hypothetical protein
MESRVTVLADEQQSFVRAISISSMPTHWASLAGVVGVRFDRHRPLQEGFIGNHAMQFGKGPFGIGSVGTPLLPGCLLTPLAFGSLSDVFQVFQTNQTVRMSVHDAFGNHMIGILLQPSLSSTYHDGSPCSGASAFLLQMLSQSRIMVGFGNDTLAGMKGTIPPRGSGDCQVANAYVYSCDSCMRLGVGSATSISRASSR